MYTLRSSQRQRRKPSVVVHYYHCRLKGRAAGTPKSTDPNKKNRNRTARERDLCDARIKVIEFLPTAAAPNPSYQFESFATEILPGYATEPASNFGILTPNNTLPSDHPGANGGRYFVIERVNADDDSETVLHQHTLEESDRIKKNTVQRTILKQERERKKAVVRFNFGWKLSEAWQLPAKACLRHRQHPRWFGLNRLSFARTTNRST